MRGRYGMKERVLRRRVEPPVRCVIWPAPVQSRHPRPTGPAVNVSVATVMAREGRRR